MLERNDLMNTKMNSMKKLAALMAVVTSVSTLTACGDAMDTSGSDYAMNNEKGAQHYTEAAIAAEDYANDAAPADDEAMPPEMNSVDNSDIQQNDEEYNYIKENGYTAVSSAPLSTFSADVDTASYTNVRRMIDDGMDVPPDAVRIEEFINYFDYDYTDPADGEPFAVHTELSDCPWNDETELLMVGINTKGFDAVLDERPAMNLVFLIDVSGSMYDDNKLPLVQKSFSMLTDNLTAADRVSIVTYAGSDEVVLEGADGNDRKRYSVPSTTLKQAAQQQVRQASIPLTILLRNILSTAATTELSSPQTATLMWDFPPSRSLQGSLRKSVKAACSSPFWASAQAIIRTTVLKHWLTTATETTPTSTAKRKRKRCWSMK